MLSSQSQAKSETQATRIAQDIQAVLNGLSLEQPNIYSGLLDVYFKNYITLLPERKNGFITRITFWKKLQPALLTLLNEMIIYKLSSSEIYAEHLSVLRKNLKKEWSNRAKLARFLSANNKPESLLRSTTGQYMRFSHEEELQQLIIMEYLVKTTEADDLEQIPQHISICAAYSNTYIPISNRAQMWLAFSKALQIKFFLND